MHIVLVSPFDFLPAEPVRPGRYGNLARELVRRGHRVTWLSSTFSHLHKRPRHEEEWRAPDGVSLVRIRSSPYPRNTHPARLWSQAEFAVRASSALRTLLRSPNPPDLVVAASPPLLSPLLAVRAAHASGVPAVVDINDLWPDAFVRFLPDNAVTRAALCAPRMLRDLAHHSPDALVAVAGDFLEHARHRHTGVFHLGHDMAAFDRAYSPGWRWPGRHAGRSIVYVGTVSLNYDLPVVLEIARRFPSDTFWIVGDGEARLALTTEARRQGLENVNFTGRLPYEDLANLLARSDVGLLGVNSRAQIWFPNKAFDYLAAGLKVVISHPRGELRELVVSERLGESYEEGNADSLVIALERALTSMTDSERTRIRALARERFASTAIYPQFAAFLERAATESRHQP